MTVSFWFATLLTLTIQNYVLQQEINTPVCILQIHCCWYWPDAEALESKMARSKYMYYIYTIAFSHQNSLVQIKIFWLTPNSQYKASKTETLDLCQLPRPPFEIHKMINLPAPVKIFKYKLKNWETDKSYFHLSHQAKRNNKLIKKIFELPHGILDCCDFNSLHAWTTFFTFSNTNLTNFEIWGL